MQPLLENRTPSSNACLDPTTAAELVGGMLPSHRTSLAEQHMDRCAACRSFVSTLARELRPPDGVVSVEWTPPPMLEHSDGDQTELIPTLEPGKRLDRYFILELVGRGGMGVVYAAYDPVLERKIALKLLQISPEQDSTTEAIAARLVREARAMAALSHPNILTVHDVTVHDDYIAIAMELVKGRTLSAWLDQQPRSWRDIVALLRDAAKGLAAAHSAGIVHRDFKPQNLLIGEDGRVKVMDFGVARWVDPDESDPTETVGITRRSSARAPLTLAGTVVGTPAYMAPEQMAGGIPDARADQYSFCVTLAEALYGMRPFPGSGCTELAAAIGSGPRFVEIRRRVPRWLRAILERGLRPQPSERFASMDELIVALGRDPSRRRARMAAALGGAMIAGAVALALGMQATS
jgi:eukaryotic-like serine/threonine-protein kinase